MTGPAFLPPEIISARIYTGPGPTPLLTAATAWDQLATTLTDAATTAHAILTELTTTWQGPTATAMTTATTTYLTWLTTTATQATHTATQARTAANAYQQARATVVPPPAITANRLQLHTLTTTNTLGQNTPAIAANQAEYAQMWAQDITAMHTYAATSATATTNLPTPTPPPPITNPTTTANPATTAATAAANSAANSGDLLSGLLNSTPVTGLENFLTNTSGFVSMFGAQQFTAAGVMLGGPVLPAQGAIAAAQLYAGLTGEVPALATDAERQAAGMTLTGARPPGTATTGAVSARLGTATEVGGLSAPQSWGTTAPAVRLANAALPATALGGAPQAGPGAPGGFGAIPPIGSVVNAPRTGGAGTAPAARANPAWSAAQARGVDADTWNRWVQPGLHGAASEKEELKRLRELAAQLTEKRDALKRSAASMIREAVRR